LAGWYTSRPLSAECGRRRPLAARDRSSANLRLVLGDGADVIRALGESDLVRPRRGRTIVVGYGSEPTVTVFEKR
jgi:hypothetical protein